jgi:transposase-like protein
MKCPECESTDIILVGWRRISDALLQGYKCQRCLYIWCAESQDIEGNLEIGSLLKG